MAKIGVALSGGGYRASLFGLGVLLYLADARKNLDVCSISSVSGGSITNGFVAQAKGYNRTDGPAFWKRMEPLARTIAHRTLWVTPLVLAYMVAVIASLPAIVWAAFAWFTGPAWSQWIAFAVMLLAWGWLVQQRGVLAGRAFARRLYSPAGRPTRLAAIEHDVDHVICATHLNAGEHFYFSGRFVYSYRFGWGTPGTLPLHVAVQSSAAFPGGFPPRWLRTKRFEFDDSGKDHGGRVPRSVTLTDGGVYDNMADEWPNGVEARAKHRPDLDLEVPDELVIVNSSAGVAWSWLRRLRIPLLGEILALMKDIGVMFDNSASLRQRGLVSEFRLPEGPSGIVVTISQSPFHVPNAFDHGNSPEAHRAGAVKAALGSEDEWDEIARSDAAVATTLSKLGTDVAARLLRHGYATAMANAHVVLDYPLLDLPDDRAFLELVT